MKTNKLIVIVVLAVVAVVLCIAKAETAGKVLYRLHPQTGKKYFIKTVVEQQITQTVAGQQQNIEQVTKMGMDFDIGDVNDRGDVWVRYTYRWVNLRQKSPMGEIAYDSSQKDVNVPPAVRGYALLLNEGFAVKLTPQANVLQVRGLDKIRNNISQKLPEGVMRKRMLKTMEQFFSEEAIKRLVKGLFVVYPERRVGIGDSWTRTASLPLGAPMTIAEKYMLKDRKDGVAILDVTSEITSDPNAKPMEIGSAKMAYELTGTQKGQLRMDETTGLLLTSKIEQQIWGQLKMTMSAPARPRKPEQPMPMEVAMPMRIRSSASMEMAERK